MKEEKMKIMQLGKGGKDSLGGAAAPPNPPASLGGASDPPNPSGILGGLRLPNLLGNVFVLDCLLRQSTSHTQ